MFDSFLNRFRFVVFVGIFNLKMIFFPEAFDYICSSRSETMENAETIDGKIIEHYRSLASKHQLWLSLGGFHQKVCQIFWSKRSFFFFFLLLKWKQKIRNESKIFNTHLIIDDQGNIVSQYNKIHLFDVQSGSNQFKESDSTQSGRQIPLPISTPIGRLALSIVRSFFSSFFFISFDWSNI